MIIKSWPEGIQNGLIWVAWQQALGTGLGTVNGGSSHETLGDPHRGPRDRVMPHASGGREDSRRRMFKVLERTVRYTVSRVKQNAQVKTRSRCNSEVPAYDHVEK